jgi:hypothetical protein
LEVFLVSEKVIADLLELSHDELLERLGAEIDKKSPSAKPLSSKEKREVALVWLRNNRERLAKYLCMHPKITPYRESKRAQDRIIVACAVADLLAAMAGIVGPMTVAALLINEGLDTLCSNTFKE